MVGMGSFKDVQWARGEKRSNVWWSQEGSIQGEGEGYTERD